MKKLITIVFLFILPDVLNSQPVYQIVGSGTDYIYHDLSLRNTVFFDAKEIKARNIKSCTIVHPWNWKNELDTLYIFDFDKTGNIIREIRPGYWDKAKKDTVNWPISELQRFTRVDSTVEKQNEQTIITKYYIWAFYWENEAIDTGYIKRYVYDDKGRLTEFIMNGTPDFLELTRCGTGITFHKKYEYDEKNRIIYYHDLYNREYAFFEHQKNRCLLRVYNSRTNELRGKYFVRFKINEEAITENDGLYTLKLTRLNKGSNLFSHISNKQNGKGTTPDDYYLIYDYFDQPGTMISDPIVTKR